MMPPRPPRFSRSGETDYAALGSGPFIVDVRLEEPHLQMITAFRRLQGSVCPRHVRSSQPDETNSPTLEGHAIDQLTGDLQYLIEATNGRNKKSRGPSRTPAFTYIPSPLTMVPI